ncbi:nitrate ABC transporter, ATP-binding protein C and D [Leptospira fainei serovar Hurstbridge str. BUT 6]|uniref:Nitrate ABC transporter, ATP-binding protein C and D n=1 Tax=Leptospira fainei serovar Hurstbridge str. BUT 6 TaxID=1193011 RepID=S3UVP8_9LEPT|nr:ABC transporter ATP-binding protein [Leptospira fainei]EPG72424.1 nitrate ABC transporter, ATP-binding protein C and D [Leptospira fainei serovar Hurstbridge str. BUT 6]
MEKSENTNFVQISNVHQIFGSGKNRYYALAGIDLNIAQGEFVSIIGHSGCGKSTLLNLVAGLITPTSGKVEVEGVAITRPGLDRAVVFQSHSLLPWLTVEENVRVAVDSVYPERDKGFRKAEALKFVEMVNLSAHSKKKPSEISGGMKQRVGIARAFATNPKVLLLDEPFGALDALTRGKMQDELSSIWEQFRKTVIMITHDIDEALYLSDRIILMSNGPKATIDRILNVRFPRKRDRESILEDPSYNELRKEMLHYLIQASHQDSVA